MRRWGAAGCLAAPSFSETLQEAGNGGAVHVLVSPLLTASLSNMALRLGEWKWCGIVNGMPHLKCGGMVAFAALSPSTAS